MSTETSFELTEHARAVSAERRIDLAWIGRVLAHPQRTEPDRRYSTLRHALGRISERDGRVLRVVYNPEQEPVRVVTAFFDRRERRRE